MLDRVDSSNVEGTGPPSYRLLSSDQMTSAGAYAPWFGVPRIVVSFVQHSTKHHGSAAFVV